jgi:ADP-ribosylglycohydrolase
VDNGAADPSRSAGLITRARAAMLTAACGDALGWPVEPRGQRVGGTSDLQPRLAFIEWTRREGGGYAPFQRRVPAGAYSDDTQLMLAVARSLSRGDKWWEHLTQFELPAWTLYELGGGGAVKLAARGWARGQAPWEAKKSGDRQRYFGAGANGVAMRILPHAIFGAEDARFDRVSERIVADGLTTHGHPRALVGGLVAGYAMWSALRWSGKVHYGELIDDCLSERQAWSRLPESALAPGWSEAAEGELKTPLEVIWGQTCEEMTALLSLCKDAIERGSLARDGDVLADLGAFGKEGGSGTRAAAAAIYLASRYVAKPTAGLLAAAFARRADTDTIACLTGAMLGAFSGDDRVDGLAPDLQDGGYIDRLAGQVATHEVDHGPHLDWPRQQKSQLTRKLADIEAGQTISLPLFGTSRVEATEQPQTKSANEIGIWWLSTELGQTLAITVSKKTPKEVRAVPESEGSPPRDEFGQMSMAEEPGVVQSTWSFIFVRSLPEALHLYRDLLGIPVRRVQGRFAVLLGNVVLEESAENEAHWKGFKAPGVVGVFVRPQVLARLHRQITEAGYRASDIGPGRHGKRFRLQDTDGHVIEVFTSPPSSEDIESAP